VHHNHLKFAGQRLVLPMLLLSGVFVSPAAEAKIKYGMWEFTVQAHGTGLPVEVAPDTYQKCITRRNPTPGLNENNKGCSKQKVKVEGDTVSWSISCETDEDKMTGGGTVTYMDDTMSGKGAFEAGGKGMPTMKLQLKYSGKRLGNCP